MNLLEERSSKSNVLHIIIKITSSLINKHQEQFSVSLNPKSCSSSCCWISNIREICKTHIALSSSWYTIFIKGHISAPDKNFTAIPVAQGVGLLPVAALKLTAVHIAAIFFLSGLLIATALLGAQYMFRYRKYHVARAEDLDSLADPAGEFPTIYFSNTLQIFTKKYKILFVTSLTDNYDKTLRYLKNI